MTDQDYFDRVVTHLVTQGWRAGASRGCMYRAPSGFTCAVGCMIPDDLYWAAMERKDVCTLLMDYPELKPFIPNPGLAVALQSVHDSDESWQAMNGGGEGLHEDGWQALEVVARDYKLTFDRRTFDRSVVRPEEFEHTPVATAHRSNGVTRGPIGHVTHR